jgi:hypothetical protein
MAFQLRFLKLVTTVTLGLAAGCSSSKSAPGNDSPDAAAAEAGAREEAGATQGDAGVDSPPTVTGPVTGGCTGKPFTAAPLDLASYGYVEQEYFFEGNATAYDWAGTPGANGQWSVKTTTSAHYKTRMLVRHPTDASKFNGTVIVEWLNVTGGVDADPDFGYAHTELLRSGFAWVGVSAQAAGVIGAPSILGIPGVPLVEEDPARYGTLKHPGDDYSYDIYTQAALALRHPGAVNPLAGITPARFVADGESQSAFRLVTYVNAIQPVRHVFDGFFIHSRFGAGALISGSADAGTAALLQGPRPARIRGDLAIPVFQFETETDILGITGDGFAASRQPDTNFLRTWEVAGTAHADQYLLDYEQGGYGDAGVIGCGDAGGTDAAALSAVLSCGTPNDGPQHWVEDTAVNAMYAWMTDGGAPAMGQPLVLADGGNAYAQDSYGNTLGGVRSPAVDVPIATYSGQPAPGSSLVCSLFGQTTPLMTAQLMTLYSTHDDYVAKVVAAAMNDQDAGFLLAADVPLVVKEAQAAPVPQ